MLIAEYKIGLSKGRPRIWIDGRKLADAGFVAGTTYWCDAWNGRVVCALQREDVGSDHPRQRKVTGRPSGKPIIDIAGADVAHAFPGATRVKVTFLPGKLVMESA